ncbi:MAG: Calx-beta domain-containing protein [Bacteroidota bacterium]
MRKLFLLTLLLCFISSNLTKVIAQTVSVRDTFRTEGNDGPMPDTLFFVVERTNATTSFNVSYTTADSTAVQADGDYLPRMGQLFFPLNGTLRRTIKVPIIGDFKTELDEIVKVNLINISSASGPTTIGDHLGLGTITNDDTSYVSVRDTFLTEGDMGIDSLCFAVDLEGAVDVPFTYMVTTFDSTANTTMDYFGIFNQPRTGSGSGAGSMPSKGSGFGVGTGSGFSAGTFRGIDTIKIAAFGDSTVELDEFFKVSLHNLAASGRPIFFRDSLGVGTIINDDEASLSISNATVTEGGVGSATLDFTVTLTGNVASPFTVDFSTCDSTATTINNDYLASMGTLNFVGTDNETQNISVMVIGDNIAEIHEMLVVKLSNISGGGLDVSFSDAIGIGRIINDDFEPTIADPCSCLENASSTTAKDGQFSETVTVTSQNGETWYITSVMGLFQPPAGAFPPAKGGNPYPLNQFAPGASGDELVERDLGNGLSEYFLNGLHVDDIGYTITVFNGTHTLSIGNLCHYETACNTTQTIVMPFRPDVSGKATINDCTADNKFISDGIHLYQDEVARYNEMTICPNTLGQTLTVSFQRFDLAIGDTLLVYDGVDTSAAFITKGSGNSIAQINGGWVTSNCDPNVNPTGCLTFAFQTNGDNRKGSGWEANVDCTIEGTTTLNRPNDVYSSVMCDSLKTRVNLRMPTINGSVDNCILANDEIIVTYCGVRDTVAAGQLTTPVFPFGTYPIEYKLLADTTITTNNFVHVAAPSLVCNDTVVTTIGQGCVTMLTPDDLIEDFCDTTGGTINQIYTIRVNTDKGFIEGSTPNFPILDSGKDGNISCNQHYEVTITRSLSSDENGCAQNITTSCTSIVQFIDGIKPHFVDLSPDTLFGCHDMDLTPDMLTPPTVIDNCELDSLIATIPPNPTRACDTDRTILVTWTAYDACGNSSTGAQNVTIIRPTKIIIPKDTIVDCGANTHPDFTGWPQIDSDGDGVGDQVITDTSSFCNFDLLYNDEMIIGTCGGDANILRIFTLYDNCETTNDLIFSDTQYVLLRDTIAPLVLCPTDNELGNPANPYRFRTDYNACTALPGRITPPTGTDNCDEQLAAIVTGVFRVSDNRLMANNLVFLSPLEVGAYRVGYILRDDCGNNSEVCNVYFNIVDQTSPTAICSDELIVSLTNGDLMITAEDIGGGSFDACGLDTLLVRRTICGSETDYPEKINDYVANILGNTEEANGWNSFLEIGCCDMNTSIRVQLLVIDKGGNANKCWLTITPENQPQSVCRDLPDAEDFCDNYATNFIGISTDVNGNQAFDEDEWQPIDPTLVDIINQQFGNPACDAINTICVNSSIEQEYQLIRDVCGMQMMRRRFRTRNTGSTIYPWYYQNIRVNYRPGWSITFPADTTLQCGTTDVGNIPEMLLGINRGTCDQIGWEVSDQVFETEDGSCFKVLREWLVINGCQHADVENPFNLPRDQVAGTTTVTANSRRTYSSTDVVAGVPLNTQGYFSYTQVIIVMDSEAPNITIADVDTCIVGVDDAMPFNEADVTPGAAPYECDTIRTFSATGMDCTMSSDLDFSYEIFDGATRVGFGEGSSFDYVVQSARTYRVRFTASDNCGNIGAAERTYTFRDCRRPIALCQGVTLNLNNAGTAVLGTTAINAYSYDNCTDSASLELRIWHPALGTTAPTNVMEVLALPTLITLDCQNLGSSTANLYVVDAAQNYSLCGAGVTLTDNSMFCPASPRSFIAGSIQTALGDMVEEVDVEVTGTGTMPTMITTDFSGTFIYEVETGAEYTIRPKKTMNPLNGVSTYDLVLMQKHILGLETFESPYNYIAADINQSGSITTFDLVQLRQLILNIIPDFPNNESWKFVNMAYPMDELNPLEKGYAEQHTITNIDRDVKLDFMAVKIGDVNGNAKPNALVASEERNKKRKLIIKTADQQLQAGQSYIVDFHATDQNQIEGYQFTLAYDGLTFDRWAGGVANESHFGFNLAKKGLITTSWNGNLTDLISAKASIFKLQFTAQKDGSLREMLSINSSITPAEGYHKGGDVLDVTLVFNEAKEKQFFDLYQNRPNPFKEKTVVGFYLPESSKATLTVSDMAGKVLKVIQGNYTKGEHTILLDRSELPSNGLLYYQLVTSVNKMTKTMLVLD